MFRGSSFHTIDSKGRIIIPTRFRELVRENGGEGLILSGMDNGLVAYPYTTWAEVERKILMMAEKSRAMRRFRRVFIGGSSDCPLDRQGRILVPQSLRQYANLNKDIVMVGVLDHFEIWSRDNWDEENRKLEEEDLQDTEVSNEIAKLGL
ncbi:MAG: division/cell wall cluster transcriptional repressor MraZ [Thermodesulfobacteriota bacterium]